RGPRGAGAPSNGYGPERWCRVAWFPLDSEQVFQEGDQMLAQILNVHGDFPAVLNRCTLTRRSAMKPKLV
ncbi:MAG: hypothetical protein ACUVSL_16125, partial [Chloroflexus sp.]|uniref:hypothetical protein n=1 Tax=Chloroflexus sp. TaxID=1904827 RepID=UPI00404A4178